MRTIRLTKGAIAYVSDEDFEAVNKFKWHLANKGYPARRLRVSEGGGILFLHNQILKCPIGMEIDHKDGNKCNCQRENMRFATSLQNGFNKRKRFNATGSKYKGVVYRKDIKKYRAAIQANKIRVILGLFDSEVDAAKKYNEAAIKLHGEFARLNQL